MEAPGQHDERVLTLLREQDLITALQETRLRAAMKRGMSLQEAVARTPLVDPVKFASIQALAIQSSEAPPHAPQEPARKPPPFTPVREEDVEAILEIDDDIPEKIELAGEEFELRDLGPVDEAAEREEEEPEGDPRPKSEDVTPEERLPPQSDDADLDLDGDLDLDLDFDLDAGTPEPEEELAFVMPPAVAALKSEKLRVPTPPAAAGTESATEEAPPRAAASPGAAQDHLLRPAGELQDYTPAGGHVSEFDLADDEGIPLIGKVNAFLRSAVDEGCEAVEFDVEPDRVALHFFGGNGKHLRQEQLDQDTAQKRINRIKVMARLEPWRRQQAQKGQFRMTHSGAEWRVLVDMEPGPDGHELLTLYCQPV